MTARTHPPIEYEVTDPAWTRNDTHGPRTYQGGLGGPCADLEPPFGYWCSASPARAPDGSMSYRQWGPCPHAPHPAAS